MASAANANHLLDSEGASKSHDELRGKLLEAVGISDFHLRLARLRAVFEEWSRTDPAGAARAIVDLPPEHRDYEAVRHVARAIADIDITTTFEFAASVKDHRVCDFIQRIALENWGTKDAEAAARYVISNFPPEQHGRSLEIFASRWGGDLPDAAIAFAQEIHDPGARASFLAGVFDGYAERDAQKAVAALESLPIEDRSSRGSLAAIITEHWSRLDPAAAARWGATLAEDDPARSASLRRSVAAWSRSDPTSVAGFLEALPRGMSKDESIAVFVYGASQALPGVATEWAARIDRPTIRRAAYQGIAQSYAERHPSEGEWWVVGLTALPESWLKDLVRRINRDGSSVPLEEAL